MSDDKMPTGIELFETTGEDRPSVGRRSFLAIVSSVLVGVIGGTASPASASTKISGHGDAKGKRNSSGGKYPGRSDAKGKKSGG